MSEANKRATAEVIEQYGFDHVATLHPGRQLIFHDGVRERTRGRKLVYLIVNPDGVTWKVGQSGLKRRRDGNHVETKHAGWSRLSSYRRVLAGNCGGRPGHETRKGEQILQEVHEGARLYVLLDDEPLATEDAVSRMIGPTESGRASTSA